jgi:putative transposase
VKPAQQRERVGFLTVTFGVGIRRACDLIGLNRSTYYVKSKARPFNAMLRERLKVNAKRVFRLYRLEGLSLRAKLPYRRAAVRRSARVVAEKANQIWSMDFMHDRLADSRAYRLLTVVNVFTRECVALEVAARFCSDDVVRVLKRVCAAGEEPRNAALRQ